MAVAARRNGRGATAPAAVLALSQFLLLATHSAACGGYSPCPKPPPVPAPCPPTPRAPTPTPSGGAGSTRCPVDALKLRACASVLGGLLSLELGGQQQQQGSSSPSGSTAQPCCQLLGGLADVDAAVCLCTALRANVLGVVQVSLPVGLSALVNSCGKKVPQGFQCAT